MRAYSMTPTELMQHGSDGWIMAQDVRNVQGKRIIKKGEILDRAAFEALNEADCTELHVVEPGPDDVHEDEAGQRLAAAIAGSGIRVKGPVLSRYNLIAGRQGVLHIDPDLIVALNRIAGISVFTHLDLQSVLPGKIVAGVKVTPLTVPKSDLVRAETTVRNCGGSAVYVKPFQRLRVAAIATEGLSQNLRQRFSDSVDRKIRWYGSTLTAIRFIRSDPTAVSQELRQLLPESDVLLMAGGNTLDPLDPALLGVAEMGGRMVHFGAPSHPGSMFWLAEIDDVPVVNLASCSMYSSVTFADLILPLIMSGERLDENAIDRFGYGGLLDREMRFRFPDYDRDVSDEEDQDG